MNRNDTNQPATDVGPATRPPNACLPNAEPSWDQLTDKFGGGTVMHLDTQLARRTSWPTCWMFTQGTG